jgi:predicted porin
MKKSLLALAVLGAFTSVASAQSSVTLFGILDMNLRQVKNDGSSSKKSMGTSGINSERLGFRGVEDLGGGLKAGFHIEGSMTGDDGTAGSQQWRRRTTASLMGGFGELRLGRDYTPTFWNTTVFDPFGTNGVGSSINLSRAVSTAPINGALNEVTYIRSNNSVGYFLPALGGVYGQLMVAPGEGGPGKYSGGRIGFGAGPVNVAAAVGSQEVNIVTGQKYKSFNIAGSYKVGPALLMAQYNNEKQDAVGVTPEFKEVRWLLGAAVTMGQGEARISYVKDDQKTTGADNNDASQIALGYVYNLSTRTALYGTYARISNKGASNFSVVGSSASSQATNGAGQILLPTAGGKSTGFEAGLRHSF